ncbi:MAG TPA: response regulator transcription factor [Thermoleophilaceae bacterium]|nr:response regulator transcription factor [Thermoleophilaceae bacterium]
MTDDVISLIVVEDHEAMRQGLELLLGRRGCVVVGSASRADEAFDLIRERRPDVAVLDVNLPDETGVSLARRLLADNPELGVLLYTATEDQKTVGEALDCGARGFALKAGPPKELIGAIRTIARGGTYFDPRLKSLIGAGRVPTSSAPILSPRERQVLDLLAKGFTGDDTAAQLFLSPLTVRTHVRNAMRKLDAHTRVHAITLALQNGEIEI